MGRNRVEAWLTDDDGGSAPEVHIFDFNGPDAASNVFGRPVKPRLILGEKVEAHCAGGDSGSPAFVFDRGVWKIAGIAIFNAGTSASSGSSLRFGAIGGGTVVAPYISWIESVITPVSGPHAGLMLPAGLALLAVR